MVPRGSPGKVRLKLRPSTGEVRCACDDRVDIVGRHQDQPALDLAGIEIADQVADRDRPFVFVAMIAALHDHGGPMAVLDHRDRHARDAPGIVMRRVRDHDEADLLAGAVEVDGQKSA